MVAIAIAAAAGWLALHLGCAAATSDRHLRRGMRRFRLPGGPPDLGDPALVNLVTSGCQLNAAAFAATILRSGRPLPGIGAGAWLIGQGRAAVVQAGGKTVRVTVRGGAAQVPPGALTRLAEIVAERLTERSEIP